MLLLDQSEANEKQGRFQKVQQASLGIFPCNDSLEMYIGYWELQQKLGIQKAGEYLKKEQKLLIDKLFEDAMKVDVPGLVSLVHPQNQEEITEIESTIHAFEELLGTMEKDYYLAKVQISRCHSYL